ncbi:DUF4123 domain-containing protein [Budvicia aquatica]|uniref:DUF4123 domain-containing protein n=1 Tax=Budvicia aquatica TaxID=82979 RepID=A0A2C6C4J1_9GAMM|nr:DUF4123 domain-containing protein [Budvicia aquatica]PHI31270.1 DUF4123 domain-containing protein [Budvicia aquatica]VFS51557.1 Uncharacterised protein [Budvicia aquatica]
MNPLPLSQWIDITATSNMQLYAVLANTGNSQAMREYYLHDGTQTPYGLYSGTPYADWFEVMPMVVPISNSSPFLDWVASTEHQDWGWLARSPFSLETIAEHMRGLTQVFLPTGEQVFFRYWDGEYMAEHLRYFGDDWRQVLPAFPFYWVNGEHFTVHISAHSEAKTFPWWEVPQGLIDSMLQKSTKPLLESTLEILLEEHGDDYLRFNLPTLTIKIERLLAQETSFRDMDGLLKKIIAELDI